MSCLFTCDKCGDQWRATPNAYGHRCLAIVAFSSIGNRDAVSTPMHLCEICELSLRAVVETWIQEKV